MVKIEGPERDLPGGLGGNRDGSDFQNLHRNKRSAVVDLKSPAGLAVFLRLVDGADVVVENYRPEVKHRLGIGYEELAKRNPGLVYASISGFGQDGPYRDRPGFDQIAQGMGGLMSITGEPGRGPMRAGIPVADLAAGLLAAQAILLALLERGRSGRGQWVAPRCCKPRCSSSTSRRLAGWSTARYRPKPATITRRRYRPVCSPPPTGPSTLPARANKSGGGSKPFSATPNSTVRSSPTRRLAPRTGPPSTPSSKSTLAAVLQPSGLTSSTPRASLAGRSTRSTRVRGSPGAPPGMARPVTSAERGPTHLVGRPSR